MAPGELIYCLERKSPIDLHEDNVKFPRLICKSGCCMGQKTKIIIIIIEFANAKALRGQCSVEMVYQSPSSQ